MEQDESVTLAEILRRLDAIEKRLIELEYLAHGYPGMGQYGE